MTVAAGVAMTLAAPALAISHGYAHAELREHAAHHGSPATESTPSVHADEQHGDHAHPRLDRGAAVRTQHVVPPALPAPATFVVPATNGRSTRTPPAPNASPPPGPARTPTQSRAPPAALTT